MKRCFVVAGLFLGLGVGLHAQVVDTTVCDVVKKPESFNGKMVRIKGTVVAGFDEFAIEDTTDPNCGFPVNAIWLSYPQGTKGKAGAAAIVEVQPARNFKGTYTPPTRTAVTLDKSKEFKQFDSLLAQKHEKGADMCMGCTRYTVTATLVGRLDTVADASLKYDAAGKIVGFGGFGNMNAYPARLVLESVADVTPKEIDYSKTDAASKGDEMPGPPTDLTSAITAAQKTAASLPASPTKDAVTRAADAYGKSGEHNGVNTSYGSTTEALAREEEQGTKDSPDGVLFNCVFNSDRLQGDALARAVVHMGMHVADLRNPTPGSAGAPPFILEYDAWMVTAITAVANNQKFLTLPGGYQIWNGNWQEAERTEKMDTALKDFLGNEAALSR